MGAGCVGDCSGDGFVRVNELVLGVNIALDRAEVRECSSFDVDGGGAVEVNELIQGVNNALEGCTPGPTPTATPTPSRPDIFYVRASGNNSNGGKSPATAFRTIGKAAGLAADGDTVIVGPGMYGNIDLNRQSGLPGRPIVFDADPSGTFTGDAPGPVVVDAGGTGAAIRLTQSTYIIIDGFTLTGGIGDNGAGLIVRSSSHNVTIRNCEIIGNRDGTRVEESDDLLMFNNLIRNSINYGVFIGAPGTGAGSQRARLINNTVVANGGSGILIGNDEIASRNAVVRNNILQDNVGWNFDVDNGPPNSGGGLSADFNLVFKSTGNPACTPESPQTACGYGPIAIRGANDVNADALFSAPNRQEYLLDQEDSPAVDAGDPDLDPAFVDLLEHRTTSPRGNIDEAPYDLGYHALQPES